MSNPETPPGPPGPLATPLAWDLVAPGYAADNVDHFTRYAAEAIRMAELRASDTVLDVATGPGSLAFLACKRAARVDALDFSPEMLRELRERAKAMDVTNVFPREGDGQALPYADASFDAAFSMFGLIFFPDRRKGFSELRRVLRPGGRAVVSSWQPMDRVPLLMAVFGALHEELPSVPFGDGKGPLSDADAFREEMSGAGFEVDVHAVTYAVEADTLETFWASARRSLAPLVLLEHRMGPAQFAPVAEGILRRLLERFGNGPVVAPMPAWLGVGRAR